MKLYRASMVVLVPLGVMLLWCVSLSVAIARGTEVSLSIAGYDPRDLLRGHYLQYRIDYGSEPPQDYRKMGRIECVCLGAEAQGVARATWWGPCEERAESTCPLFIKGRREYRSFVAGIERFYFPEEYQQALIRVPENATITVRITNDGRAYVRDMYVAGESVLEYARRMNAESRR